MYSQIIWIITDDNKINFIKSHTPKITREILDSKNGRASTDIVYLSKVLLNLKGLL